VSTRELNGHRAKNRRFRDPQAAESVDTKPHSSHADVPPFVSAALRRFAARIEELGKGKPENDELGQRLLLIAQRLATDPRMRRVWRTLGRYGKPNSVIYEFIESACITEFSGELSVKDRAKGKEFACSVAEACRDLANVARLCSDPTLLTAFTLVAEYFEKSARDWERVDPGLVKNHIKDDTARAYVRKLGRLTHHLFGDTLYRTVATTATVSLERPIAWQQVRNWCKLKSGKPRSRK
jgi:hypothetical protein